MEKRSKIFRLNLRDIGKGIVTAIFSAIAMSVYQSIESKTGIDVREIGQVAASAGIGYLLKNLFDNSKGEFLSGEYKPNK